MSVSPDAAERRSRRSASAMVAAALIGLAVYALVLFAYSESARTPQRPDLPDNDRVSVYFEPTAVRPAERAVDTFITVVPPAGLVGADGRLTKDLELTLYSELGARVVTFTAGSPTIALNAKEPAPFSSGSYDTYPLDQYTTKFDVFAEAKGEAGTTPLATQAAVWGDVPGWVVQAQEFPGTSAESTAEPPNSLPTSPADESTQVVIAIDRSGSTVTIVSLLLLAMSASTLLGLAVAAVVWQRKRRPEPTLASWGAAMLFALVPLRLNMPGAPPIGAWIDFIVFLWVLLLTLLAEVGIVAGWLRYGARPSAQ